MTFVEEVLTREELLREVKVKELIDQLNTYPLAKMTRGELLFLSEVETKMIRSGVSLDELVRLAEIKQRLE